MIDSRYLPDAVQWSEGMLLSPQHFQQQDIFTQALIQQRLLALSPYNWGVRHLKMDAVRLADGTVSVTEFEGVMPDGLPVNFTAADGRAPRSINVADQVASDGRPLNIWLMLPPRTGAMQVPSTSIKRYESLPGVETIDEVTGIGDVVVERQRVRLELHAGDYPLPGYPAICLMKVVRDVRGEIALHAFHPPMLRVSASDFLGDQSVASLVATLREGMWEKLRELAGTVQDDVPDALATLSAEARVHLMVARELAACLPLLDVVLSDPNTGPAAAYHALAQIVGRVAGIGSNPRPLAMEAYAHENCIDQFQAAIEWVTRKLKLINTDWDNLAFARVDEGLFARRLPEDAGSTVYIELRPREGQTLANLQDWLGDACIASEDLLPTLRQRRLAGAQWRLLGAREATALGLRADAIVCELRSQRLELSPHGVVDCFRAGRSMLVSGGREHAPAAILLHHRKRGRPAPTVTHETEAVHA